MAAAPGSGFTGLGQTGAPIKGNRFATGEIIAVDGGFTAST